MENNISGKVQSGEAFVAAKGTLLLKKDGTAGTDDMWVQAGYGKTDVKLGRFEAADLFPVGKDVLVLGGDTGYRANTLRGRTGGKQFHGALNMKSDSGFGFELGVVEEKAQSAPGKTCTPVSETQNVCTDGTPLSAAKGVRPVLSFAAGDFSLSAGAEKIKTVANASQTGVGITGAYALGEKSFISLNVAKNSKADAQGMGVTMVYGALGLAAYSGETADVKSNTVYAAYSFPLLGIEGATITPAISSGKVGATGERQSGGRVRFNYTF